VSLPRYRIHPKLVSLLHERGLTVAQLAAAIGSGRAHVTQVLAGVPGRGGQTRRKLARVLSARELGILGWDDAGETCHKERSKGAGGEGGGFE
jgi:transcriptional regulator with XRE-family HTH domain